MGTSQYSDSPLVRKPLIRNPKDQQSDGPIVRILQVHNSEDLSKILRQISNPIRHPQARFVSISMVLPKSL